MPYVIEAPRVDESPDGRIDEGARMLYLHPDGVPRQES
jgi:hypothetical protein